ncbi:MAG: alpha/beta hydrolase [Chloroflexi bacterium]|nr:alpha/beta hydrolase [Chloroflexota bacterium]
MEAERQATSPTSAAPRDPPRPTSAWLTTNGLRMHYLDWRRLLASTEKREGAGLPVVTLHGLASSAHWYDLTLPHLAPYYPAFSLDLRGHGLTDQPPTGYEWQTLAADVCGALDALGLGRVALLGHSWGANVALKAAALHPDRVVRLVLIDGGFFGRMAGLTWEEFKQRLRPRDIYGPRERYLGALHSEFAHVWSDELERIVMTMPRVDPDGTLHERLEPANHAQVLWAMWSEPSSASYGLVRCPTLLVAASPRETPENAPFLRRRREMVDTAQQAIPNAQAQWIADTGHDIGYEKPRELAEAIHRFLRGTES